MSSVGGVDLYGASYRNFASALYAEIRRGAFGEDIGQTGWLTAEEQDLSSPGWGCRQPPACSTSHAARADRPCGSQKGPDARVVGLDLHAEGIAGAKARAKERGLEDRAEFHDGDAAAPLPFADRSFDALMCIDAVNHLPDRRARSGNGAASLSRADGCCSPTRSF